MNNQIHSENITKIVSDFCKKRGLYLCYLEIQGIFYINGISHLKFDTFYSFEDLSIRAKHALEEKLARQIHNYIKKNRINLTVKIGNYKRGWATSNLFVNFSEEYLTSY